MPRARRTHNTSRRTQPYAWLGVGAVTVGMGVAIVGGPAVAFADAGSDTGGSSSVATDKPSNSTAAHSDAPRKAIRGPRAAASSGSIRSGETAEEAPAGRRGRVPAGGLPLPAASVARGHARTVTPGGDSALAGNKPAPAADVAHLPAPAADVAHLPAPAADVAQPSAPAADVAQPSASAASVAATAAEPAPSMNSWLPSTPIVPGAHVKLALQQIEQAQKLINEKTWGAGNVLAGLGSFGPQAALASAQLMLAIWTSSIGNAQDLVRHTAGNPLVHWAAQANLRNQMLWPKLSGLSLSTANALITPLGWVGADVATAQATVVVARQNGTIYAQVPIRIVAGTEPVVDVKLNGGTKAPLLVDSGASGIVTTRDKVGSAVLGPVQGSGNSCFSGGACYHYQTYNMPVDLGDGASATALVNLVTDNAEYPNSEADFKRFFDWGAAGILGVGANTVGPGPAPIPTAAMPGELSDGVLIYQNAYPFGLGGYMILGPNLFPTRVSLPGAPDAYVKVSVNGGAKQDAAAIIDSGGVFGTLNRSLYPGSPAGSDVPAGAKVDVYAPDGATLLYSYTTQAAPSATPFIDSGLFNTGNAPYAQNPIYLNYGATPYGIGSTDFSIA